jgi:hypothetical protein
MNMEKDAKAAKGKEVAVSSAKSELICVTAAIKELSFAKSIDSTNSTTSLN